jgi:hypothetical protein
MALSVTTSEGLDKKSPLQRYQPAVEWLLIGLLGLLLLFKGLIPGWRTLNTDFPNYYVVARLVAEHYCLDRIYDWIWLQRIADHMGISHQIVGFLSLTPFSALPILPLSWLSPLEAKRVWLLCNGALLAAVVSLLSRSAGMKLRTAWLIALCSVIPLRTEFVTGQMHLLVLALLASAYVSHMRGRQALSGLCIGLAAALKVYPIFFCVYFLAKQRWKALAATIAVIVCCVIASWLVFGSAAMTAYLSQQLPRSLQGESMNAFLPSATSSAAMFHRLFLFEPELNPHPLRQSTVLYSVVYPLWQALLAGLVLARIRTSFRADDRETLEWSLFTTLLLFLSSTPASYHFVVLISAAIPCTAVLVKSGRKRAACAFLALYITACNARTLASAGSHITAFTPLLYIKLWAGIALLAFLAAIITIEHSDGQRSHTGPWSSYGTRAVALCVLLWIIGSLNSWHHLRRLGDDNTQRLVLKNTAYLMNQPSSRDSDLYYIGMQANSRYRLVGDKRNSNEINNTEHDELSYAIDSSGQSLWLEVASGSGSHITRISFRSLNMATCEIDDGEDPAIAMDGSWLAFIREDHGHGTLWLADSLSCTQEGDRPKQRAITPLTYDVRSVGAGPGNSFIFSAIYGGREKLFSITSDGLTRPITDEDAALESPSLSPGGNKIAASKLVRNRWQLISFDLTSKVEHQLTFGDCNATTPSWKDENTILYATDCERGQGLSALAWRSANP